MSLPGRRRRIDAAFILPYRSDSPRFSKVETFSPVAHGHWLRIRRLEELDDEVQGWARDAYRVGLKLT